MKGEDKPPVLTNEYVFSAEDSIVRCAGWITEHPTSPRLLITHENCKCCEITEHEHVVFRVTKSSLCFI